MPLKHWFSACLPCCLPHIPIDKNPIVFIVGVEPVHYFVHKSRLGSGFVFEVRE